MAKSRKLTEKQRRFVEAFMGKASGNATEAARLAGYSGTQGTLQSIGTENLSKPVIQKAIGKRQEKDPLVMTREERQRFWTEVVRNDRNEMKDRLRASEILGKSCGDFIERVESDTTLKVIVEYTD